MYMWMLVVVVLKYMTNPRWGGACTVVYMRVACYRVSDAKAFPAYLSILYLVSVNMVHSFVRT